jgi:hypothetical protein
MLNAEGFLLRGRRYGGLAKVEFGGQKAQDDCCMKNDTSNVPAERIEEQIVALRGKRVMLDRDLANLYGVTTGNLNKAVQRNRERFPDDFTFQLTVGETESLMFQSGISKKRGGSRHFPHAFTQEGIAMLSSVLRSKRAVQVNIAVMRAFIKLREMLGANLELARKFGELEARVGGHDEQIAEIIEAIRELMSPPPEKPKKEIGFHIREDAPPYRVGKKTAKRASSRWTHDSNLERRKKHESLKSEN